MQGALHPSQQTAVGVLHPCSRHSFHNNVLTVHDCRACWRLVCCGCLVRATSPDKPCPLKKGV
jgi:hypothetical protein